MGFSLTRQTTNSMVLIPCILLAVFPPGILFPQMAARMSAPGRAAHGREEGDKNDSEKQSQPDAQDNQKQAASGEEAGVGEGHASNDTSGGTTVDVGQ